MVLRMRKNLILSLSLLPLIVFAADPATMKADMQKMAKDSNAVVKPNYASSTAINNSVVTPINGASKMKTFDGKTEFDGKLVCKGSSEFAKFIIKPESNGDITLLNIFQDTNMDGAIDSSTPANWRMSAVCFNGFMTCSDPNDSGTCTSYQWSGSPVGRTQVALTDLGGCYCINNKCGNNLVWRNLPQIVKDIGTGIAGALQSSNPWYTLSDVKVDGVQGTLVGGESSSCSVGDAGSLVKNTSITSLSSYATNNKKLSSDAATQTVTNNGFLLLKNGATNVNDSSTMRTCELRRNVSIDEPKLDEIITFDGGEGSVTQCGPDCLQLVVGQLGDNNLVGHCAYFQYYSRFFIKDPTRIKSAILQRTVFDDWLQLWVDNNQIFSGPEQWLGEGAIPGRCELNTRWSFSLNKDVSDFFKKKGQVSFRTRVEVSGDGIAYALMKVTADLSCRAGEEYISNGCSAYEADTACKLVEESVDGVSTFTSGIKTGLVPLEQTRTLNGNFCSITTTKPWFYKKRTYRCKNEADTNTENIKRRVAYIKDNVTPQKFKDMQISSSSVKYSEGPLSFDGLPSAPSCTLVCKTRAETLDPSISTSGSVSGKQAVTTYNTYYHECSSDNVCPAGDGEKVVKQCQCLDEFADAAAIMQILRQAGQDMICSSGETKNPDGSSK